MNKPANTLRGETHLRIGDEQYVLRPSFENLVAAEEELGSLFAMVERASQGSLTIAEISTLLWHCLPHTGRPTREEAGEAVLNIGLIEATHPVRAVLAQVLQGRA